MNDAIVWNIKSPRAITATMLVGSWIAFRRQAAGSLLSTSSLTLLRLFAISWTAVGVSIAVYYYTLVAVIIFLSEKSDMGDIESHYGPREPDGTQTLLNAFFVATDPLTSTIVGLVGVQGSRLPDQPQRAELRRMCVRRDQRRKGVGSALCKAVLAHVQSWNKLVEEDRKVQTLALSTTRFQIPAIRLYEKEGWRRVGDLEFAFGLEVYQYERAIESSG
ncbi:hypothetical protein HDU93_004522 [Gonapodya sp. JEL0774]|nr:hypothetical protein HDU93_004522 [Gonapodya sp. JEL0774]